MMMTMTTRGWCCVVLCAWCAVVCVSARRPTAGGYRAINITDPEVAKVASLCVHELNQRSNSIYPLQLKRVATASVQVVAGLNVKIVFEAEAIDKSTNTVVLTMSKECLVWDRFGTLRVTSLVDAPTTTSTTTAVLAETLPSVLNPSNLVGAMSGGWRKVDTKDDQLAKVTAFCVQQLNAESKSADKYALVSTLSADAQTVAGIKWRVNVSVRRGTAASPEMHTFTVLQKLDKSMQVLEHYEAQA